MKYKVRSPWCCSKRHYRSRVTRYAGKGMVVLALLLASDLALSQEGQAPAESTEAQAPEVVHPTTEEMKLLIATKNIFEPKNKPISQPELPDREFGPKKGPQKLLRPFRVKGFFQTEDGVSKAYLYFEESGQIQEVSVGDRIQTITIRAIEEKSLLCDYDGVEVRIGWRKTSNDAWNRIQGLSSGIQPELMGTIVPADNEGGPFDEAVALFSFASQEDYSQVRVGEKVGKNEVVKIEAGKVTVRDQLGFEYDMVTGTAP